MALAWRVHPTCYQHLYYQQSDFRSVLAGLLLSDWHQKRGSGIPNVKATLANQPSWRVALREVSHCIALGSG